MTKYNDLGNDTLNIHAVIVDNTMSVSCPSSLQAAYLISAQPPHLFPSTWRLNKEVWSFLFQPRDQAWPDDEFLRLD